MMYHDGAWSVMMCRYVSCVRMYRSMCHANLPFGVHVKVRSSISTEPSESSSKSLKKDQASQISRPKACTRHNLRGQTPASHFSYFWYENLLWTTVSHRLAFLLRDLRFGVMQQNHTERFKLCGCLHLHLPKIGIEKTWEDYLLDLLPLAPKIRSTSKYSLTAGLLILSSKTPRGRATSEKLPGQKCSTNDWDLWHRHLCFAQQVLHGLNTKHTLESMEWINCKFVHVQGF